MTYNPEYLDIIPIDVDTLPEAADTINLNFQNIAASINGVVSGVVAPFSYALSHKTGGNSGCLDALVDMVDGETAIVLEGDRILFYVFDSSSNDTADGVYTIEPAVDPGTKRWKLSGQPLKLWQLGRAPGIADDYTSGVMVADFCVDSGVLYVCSSNAYNNATWAVVPRLGTTAGTACEGNDSRLSDARTPTAHASTHVDTDPIPLATAASKGLASAAQITKLNGIESGADVTDAQNVAASGAIMDGDFSTNGIMCRDGLGIYSVKVVGTGSGQIAAGNDSRFPSSSEKEALVGTSGTPSVTNKYVTDQDARMTDARTPTLHGATKHTGTIGTESQITFDPVGGHNHDGTGSRRVDHASLLNIGSNTHAQIDSHIAAASPHSGHLTLGGQLGNTVSAPDVRGIRETSGPTLLSMGAVADRGLLSRSGSMVVSVPVPDVIGGKLIASSTTLIYVSEINGYITLWDGTGYVTVPHGTPSLANTGTDMNGTTLAYDVNYDVFIRYESASSSSLKLAKWASSGEGTSARFAAWVTSTAYVIGHRVTQSGSYYSCIQAHTSGASTQPGSGASWANYWVVQTQSADTSVPGLHFTGTYLSYCGNATGATSFDGRKYRWVGVVRLRNNSSVPNFADDDTYRYTANAFNMSQKYMKCTNSGGWTYAVATTVRESNGGTGQVRGYCVLARPQTVPYRFFQLVSTSATSAGVYVAPVFNQVTSQSGYCVGFTTSNNITPLVVVAHYPLAYGYNWFSTTEYLSGAITGTFWGGNHFLAVARLMQ